MDTNKESEKKWPTILKDNNAGITITWDWGDGPVCEDLSLGPQQQRKKKCDPVIPLLGTVCWWHLQRGRFLDLTAQTTKLNRWTYIGETLYIGIYKYRLDIDVGVDVDINSYVYTHTHIHISSLKCAHTLYLDGQ